ncbi:hypothetical protein AUP68_04358 [Ilyonectria robusta]
MSDNDEFTRNEILHKIQTSSSIPISPELFEQLYLAPKTDVKGQLRQTFGNPTPIGLYCFIIYVDVPSLLIEFLKALGGLLLCAMPLSMVLLGWQGAGGFGGAANV